MAVLHSSRRGVRVFYESELRGTDSSTAASLCSPGALSAPDWSEHSRAWQEGISGHPAGSLWLRHSWAAAGACDSPSASL